MRIFSLFRKPSLEEQYAKDLAVKKKKLGSREYLKHLKNEAEKMIAADAKEQKKFTGITDGTLPKDAYDYSFALRWQILKQEIEKESKER